ncbi:hypothetical protein EDB83DRAFT_2520215 [Lactarius deliciosus]|nr:hypothetical protein EDB83DRAFT_2520215 [Lactarius deliciosus]
MAISSVQLSHSGRGLCTSVLSTSETAFTWSPPVLRFNATSTILPPTSRPTAPNLVNDGHDTTIGFADQWVVYWLVPTFNDTNTNVPCLPNSQADVSLADLPLTNITDTIPGPLNVQYYVPITAPNTSAVGAGGVAVFVASGLDTRFTAISAPAPVNLTAQGKTVPWLGPRVAAAASSNMSNGNGQWCDWR